MFRVEVNQLPPSSASPNSRANWAKKYKDAKVYGLAVFYACVDARNKLERFPLRQALPFEKARLNLTFIYGERRVRDLDNLIARFKSGQDALVKAGLVLNDDPGHLILGDIHIEVDKARAPRTIIELMEEGIDSASN